MAMSYYEYQLRSQQSAGQTDRAVARTRSNADTRIARIGAQYQNLGDLIQGTAQVLSTAMTQHFNFKIAQLEAENIAAQRGLEFGLKKMEVESTLQARRLELQRQQRLYDADEAFSSISGAAGEQLSAMRSSDLSFEDSFNKLKWFDEQEKANPKLAFSTQWQNHKTAAADLYNKSSVVPELGVSADKALRSVTGGGLADAEQVDRLQKLAQQKLGITTDPVVRAMLTLKTAPHMLSDSQKTMLASAAAEGKIVTKEWLAQHMNDDMTLTPAAQRSGYLDAGSRYVAELSKLDPAGAALWGRQYAELLKQGDFDEVKKMLTTQRGSKGAGTAGADLQDRQIQFVASQRQVAAVAEQFPGAVPEELLGPLALYGATTGDAASVSRMFADARLSKDPAKIQAALGNVPTYAGEAQLGNLFSNKPSMAERNELTAAAEAGKEMAAGNLVFNTTADVRLASTGSAKQPVSQRIPATPPSAADRFAPPPSMKSGVLEQAEKQGTPAAKYVVANKNVLQNREGAAIMTANEAFDRMVTATDPKEAQRMASILLAAHNSGTAFDAERETGAPYQAGIRATVDPKKVQAFYLVADTLGVGKKEIKDVVDTYAKWTNAEAPPAPTSTGVPPALVGDTREVMAAPGGRVPAAPAAGMRVLPHTDPGIPYVAADASGTATHMFSEERGWLPIKSDKRFKAF